MYIRQHATQYLKILFIHFTIFIQITDRIVSVLQKIQKQLSVFDKKQKQQIQNIIDQVNKVQIPENPLDAFQNDQQFLVNLYTQSLELLKTVKVSIQPFCIKLAATLIPFLNKSINDVLMVQSELQYLLVEFTTKDGETIKQLLYFIHELLKSEKLINIAIIQASFRRLQDIQQYNLTNETKMMLEATYELLLIYIFRDAKEEVRQKFNGFLLFCLQSQEKSYYINSQEIQKIPALFVLSMIKNILKQVGQLENMKDLLDAAMTTKFQTQQIPEGGKYLSSGKTHDLSQIDWRSCSAPVLIYAVKDTKLKQQQAYQALIVNLQVQIACQQNLELEYTFKLIKTLYDQLNQIQEKQEWQQVLIYSAILVILRQLQQTRNLESEFMTNIINTISNYLISTQQVKQEQIQYVIDPEQIIMDAFKQPQKHYFNFIDLQYFINPQNYNYMVNRHTAELNSCLIIEQIITIMQAYSEGKFNPNLKLEEQLIEIAMWIFDTLGKSNIPYYTIKIASQFLCKLALNIDKGVDYDEKQEENKIEQQNKEETEEQELYTVNQIKKRTLDDAMKIYKLLLSIPKRLIHKDENQMWTTPYKIDNYMSIIAFYNELAYNFPMFQHVEMDHWIEFNFLSINLFITTMMSTGQIEGELDFLKLQQLLIKNLESQNKPISILANRFNDIYNLQTDKAESDLLSRKIQIKNYLMYLNSLCNLQLYENTPQKIQQIFGQIMLDEFIFCNDEEFPTVIQVCQSELFNTLLQAQLGNENMKHIARRTIVELMIYQYIAKEIDQPHQIDEFYNKIINYFKVNEEAAKHYQEFDYFQMFEKMIKEGNSLFVLQLLCQVIEFALQNEMNLLQKDKIINLIDDYYQNTTTNCQIQMISCLQSLSQQKVITQFSPEQQEKLYQIYTQILRDYYQMKLKFGVDNTQLYQTLINFYVNGDQKELIQTFYKSLVDLCKENTVDEINVENLITNVMQMIMMFRETACFKAETLTYEDLDDEIIQFSEILDQIYEAEKVKSSEGKIIILDIYIQKYIELLKFFKQEEMQDQLRKAFTLLIDSVKEEYRESKLYPTHMLYFFRLLALPQITQANDELFSKIHQIIISNPEYIYNEESLQNYRTYILSVYTNRQDHHQDIADQLLFLAGKHDELVAAGAITVPLVQKQPTTVKDPKVAQLQEQLSHMETPTMAGNILTFYKEMIQSTDDQEFLISQCQKIYDYTLKTQNIVSNRQHMMIIKKISEKVEDKKAVFQLYKDFYVKALEKENLTQQQYNLFSIIYIFLITKIQKAQIEIPEEIIDIVYQPALQKDINSIQVKQQMLYFLYLDIDKYQQRFVELASQIITYLMPSVDIQYTADQLVIVEQRKQRKLVEQEQQQEQQKEQQEQQEQPQEEQQPQQQEQQQQDEQINVQESQKTNLKEFLEDIFQKIQTICLEHKDKQYIQEMLITLVRQVAAAYQKQTPNENYMLQFLQFTITNWQQLTTKYYKALSLLFSQQNHLIQIRTLFYDTIGTVCQFE